jgi:hypothetical protein
VVLRCFCVVQYHVKVCLSDLSCLRLYPSPLAKQAAPSASHHVVRTHAALPGARAAARRCFGRSPYHAHCHTGALPGCATAHVARQRLASSCFATHGTHALQPNAQSSSHIPFTCYWVSQCGDSESMAGARQGGQHPGRVQTYLLPQPDTESSEIHTGSTQGT